MIAYPPSLQAAGGARTGIAPVNLIDVQDVNGNTYFWSDRRISTISALADIVTLSVPVDGRCVPWRVNGGINASYSVPGLNTGLDPASIPVTPGAVVRVSWVSGTASVGGSYPYVQPLGSVPGGNAAGQAGQFVLAPVFTQCLIGAWADSTGQLVTAPFGVGNDSGDLTVPAAATQLLLGMNDGVQWGDNYGLWNLKAVITNGAISVRQYDPWLLTVPELTFHRSSVADLGSFVLQNLSGDTISRDLEKIMRRSALEGSFCIFRSWQPDAQASWIEIHGKLTVEDVGVDTVTLKGEPAINPAQDDTPLEEFSETCQLQWGQARCGATGTTECQYSFQSCQVVERIMAAPNSYEKNYGEAIANVPTQLINRRRRI